MNVTRSIKLLYTPFEYDDKGRKRFGAWSQAYSGERYWTLDPLPEEVHTIDVVQGLVNAARYRGQTKFFYPVLTHSTLVSVACEQLALERGWSVQAAKDVGFEGLYHDSPEAFLGDVARPLKRMRTMREYCKVEKLWEDAIFTRMNIHSTPRTKKLVHEVDHRIVLDEIRVLMKDPDMWQRAGRYPDLKPLGIEVPNWTREESIRAFYQRYNELRPIKGVEACAARLG
jgi:uncharacterized protein